MTSSTVFRSIAGRDFDRPDLALHDDFLTLRRLLAQEADRLIPFGQAPMRYEENVKELHRHFKRCVEAGRAYIAAYQDYIKGDTAPHPKAVIDDLKKQAQELTEKQEQAA